MPLKVERWCLSDLLDSLSVQVSSENCLDHDNPSDVCWTIVVVLDVVAVVVRERLEVIRDLLVAAACLYLTHFLNLLLTMLIYGINR